MHIQTIYNGAFLQNAFCKNKLEDNISTTASAVRSTLIAGLKFAAFCFAEKQ